MRSDDSAYDEYQQTRDYLRSLVRRGVVADGVGDGDAPGSGTRWDTEPMEPRYRLSEMNPSGSRGTSTGVTTANSCALNPDSKTVLPARR